LIIDNIIQGRIACCNVLSDLYSVGVDQIDTVLMCLGISLKMNDKEKEVVTGLMIAGRIKIKY
jgi:selenide,water dikinase